jgi:D-sedoheptulose 7-phosphate isomerase
VATIFHQQPSTIHGRDGARRRLVHSLASRSEAARLLISDAERVARACYAMSERFHRGGKLIVFGAGSSSTDAQHVAVEFLHPVIVGKRTLPAIALTNDIATITGVASACGFDDAFVHQIHHLAMPEDIALGIDSGGLSASVLRALQAAKEQNLLTIVLTVGEHSGGGSAIDFEFIAHSDNRLIAKEIQVTTYHIVWELVHVFFEHPGVLGPSFTQ